MERLKAVCAVAHPDDCVIFARPFIDVYNQFDWEIVYLTYKETDERAAEMSRYWNARNIKTTFLGYIDDYHDNETGQFLFWKSYDAHKSIVRAIDSADMVLTHNLDGDYGHIHHKLVARAVTSIGKPVVYFAGVHQASTHGKCSTGSLNLEQFPLHKDVIAQFNNINTGYYDISETAWEHLKPTQHISTNEQTA